MMSLLIHTQCFANKQQELRTTHQEGEVVILQQLQKAMDGGYRNVKEICDDIDIFILLLLEKMVK